MTHHRKHIAIIDPGAGYPELDTFNQLVVRSPRNLIFSYHLPALHGLQSLQLCPQPIAACMILGSSASVNSAPEWQEQLWSWLELNVIAKKIPLLGICYGHQLIAFKFGGKVDFFHSDQGKLQGRRVLTVRPGLGFRRGSYSIYMSHREVVQVAPDDLQIFMHSDVCAIEGLKHASLPIWTIAGHPEATSGFLANQKMPIADKSEFVDGHTWLSEWLAMVQ